MKSLKEAKENILGEKLKQQVKRANPKELAMGKKVELEHGTVTPPTNITGNDPVETLKIAMAHLNEIPDYYTRLARMEQEGKKSKK